mmetsp:Transcript_57672/g.155592  ORF Transcript_57672/g.155592 Transcript_57672/m.155592 type:complete len:178 (-) Transcript_57672:37-570(-)
MRSFDELTRGSMRRERVAEVEQAAEAVARGSGYFDEAPADSEQVREAVARIRDVLLRVKSNAFEFHNGSELGASALYWHLSFMNHSCAPNVELQPQWGSLSPGSLAAGDGAVAARATCRLAEGQPLSINYGPAALPSWTRQRRLAHLLEEHGFECRCDRCEREGAAEAGPGLLSTMD